MTFAIIGRLAVIQLLDHRSYAASAANEHDAGEVLFAHRGPILDRNGFALALSVDVYALQVDPSAWTDPATAQQTAQTLALSLGRSPESILAAVQTSDGRPTALATDLPYDTGRRLAAMHLPGVLLISQSSRTYPEDSLASNVLGFVGADGNGLTGIELDMNSRLAGTNGSARFEQDALGRPIGGDSSALTEPQDGGSVTLTLDREVQAVAEQQLDKAIAKSGADGGTVIAMNPKTGAILALASRPSFGETTLDLGNSQQADLYRDRAVTDAYEPGSVFKLITMAGALDGGVVTPNTTYFDSGTFQIGPVKIQNWDHSAHGITTMTTVIVDSLNTGAAWVSQHMGAKRFYDYVQRFGFGQPTGVDLSGEAAGQVRTPSDPAWTPVDLATNAYGQGISATPLQMITAVAAIVNGGHLMRPYIVQSVSGPQGVKTTNPTMVRQVVSPQTATEVRQMMRGELAAYTLAQVPGYSGGGKSGTAYISGANGYAAERTIPSYLEFIPYDHPQIVLLTKLDNLDTNALGGEVAAPLARDILTQIAPILHIPADQPSSGTAGKTSSG